MAEAGPAKVERTEASPPDKPKGEVTVELSTPVQAHGDTLKKLTFREPTGGDLMTLEGGWPVDIDWTTGKVIPNAPAMGAIMSVLAAVPPSTIKALKGKDFTNCAHRLMGFFVPDAQVMQF